MSERGLTAVSSNDARDLEKGTVIPPSLTANTQASSVLKLAATPGFGAWLEQQQGFITASTLASEMLLFLGGSSIGEVTVGARKFGFTRGISADATRMWVAGNTRIFHLVNIGSRTISGSDYDAVYVPQRAHFVGRSLLHDIVHDVRLGDEQHEVVFVNTSYSVIATIDRDHSFRPLWKPRHITRLAPEDRCHLNCVGIRDGRVTYASMFNMGDSAEGWRDVAAPDSGVVIDVASGDVMCAGLTKPHSMKWHRDRLWILDSGTSRFGYVDEQAGRFVPVANVGNFPRGLLMLGDYAVIGSSPLRGQRFTQTMAVPGFSESDAPLLTAAIHVVDLRTGNIVHALVLSGLAGIYDLTFVPDIKHPFVPKFGEPDGIEQWTTFAPDLSAASSPAGFEPGCNHVS